MTGGDHMSLLRRSVGPDGLLADPAEFFRRVGEADAADRARRFVVLHAQGYPPRSFSVHGRHASRADAEAEAARLRAAIAGAGREPGQDAVAVAELEEGWVS